MPTLEAPTEAQLLRQVVWFAQSRGYSVKRPTELARWMTPAEIGAAVGLKGPALTKRLRSTNCPPFDREKGAKRTLRILCHERLLDFLKQPKQPGTRLA